MNLLEALEIEVEAATADFVRLRMPIKEQHKQPFGLVHGGINGVLIETACSIGANQALAQEEAFAAGIDLQVNHLAAAQEGTLIVEATIWLASGLKTAVGRCTLTTVRK